MESIYSYRPIGRRWCGLFALISELSSKNHHLFNSERNLLNNSMKILTVYSNWWKSVVTVHHNVFFVFRFEDTVLAWK